MSFKPFPAPPRTYLITHLSREFGVTSRALRYYEEIGLVNPVRQDGARIYSKRDRARLILILRGRAVGLPLEEIGQILDLYESEGKAAQAARALHAFRRQVQLLETQREEAEKGIAILRAEIERLSRVDPLRSSPAIAAGR